LKSGLTNETLLKIWQISDTDKDGNLNFKEFCYAMHLINGVRMGQTLPDSLPEELKSSIEIGTENKEQELSKLQSEIIDRLRKKEELVSILRKTQQSNTEIASRLYKLDVKFNLYQGIIKEFGTIIEKKKKRKRIQQWII